MTEDTLTLIRYQVMDKSDSFRAEMLVLITNYGNITVLPSSIKGPEALKKCITEEKKFTDFEVNDDEIIVVSDKTEILTDEYIRNLRVTLEAEIFSSKRFTFSWSSFVHTIFIIKKKLEQ